MSKQLKRYLADDLKTRLGDERDVVLMDVAGLTVANANDLRNQLRSTGSRMTTLRNRVAVHAFKDLGMDGLSPQLGGMNAIAFGGEDGVLGVARTLSDWAKKHKEGGIRLTGGLMEGNALGPADVQTLATLPSRDQLLGMIASAVSAPMQQIAAQINEMFAGVARGIDAVREQKEQAGE